MHLVVDKDNFSKILLVCENISTSYTVSGKPHSLRPLHAYVEMKVEEKNLKLSVMRETMSGCFYYVPKILEGVEEGDRMLVQTSELRKLISSRYSGDISLEVVEEELIIKQGSFTAKLPLYRQEVFPEIIFDVEWKALPKKVLEMLEFGLLVIDSKSILIDVTEEGTFIFTYTPTQVLFGYNQAMVGVVGRHVVSVDSVKTIVNCFKGEENLEFGFVENKFCIKTGSNCAYFGLVFDDMPLNYRENITFEGLRVIKVNRQALLFILESVSQVLAKWDQLILVTIVGDKKMMNMKAKNLMTNAEANESLRVETELVDFQLGIPSNYILKYLKSINDEFVTLHVSERDKPILVQGSEGLFSMGLVPFRI